MGTAPMALGENSTKQQARGAVRRGAAVWTMSANAPNMDRKTRIRRLVENTLPTSEPNFDAALALREMLGYLNLSSGAPDARFRRRMNELFGWLESRCSPNETAWRTAPRLLLDELRQAHGASTAFAETRQAQAVIDLTFKHVLPAYLDFHSELLFHQTEAALFRPFFVARAFEATLQEGGPWNETQRIVPGAIRRLNDFIGYRPVAVLHNTQRMEPYPHEWVCPIPLYFRDAGVSAGRYHDLVAKAIEILHQTDERILRQARFEPGQLDELALDPRAYDFDHPVNRRVNYQFGQWDPSLIDNRGLYRRFVITSVTLDCLMERLEATGEGDYEQRLFETAAVLAGVVLMAAGVSGSGPDDHDSNTTLATLVKHVAGYRDEFYTWLLSRMPGEHGERLRTEARDRQQAFAAVRQGLNQCLSRRRALQMQHVFLATLYARMGFPDASRRQVSMVAIPSARIQCEIDCQLATGKLEAEHGELVSATRRLRQVDSLLHRGIECGAIVDPWNILGFGGQFSLFPALENSVRDHRAIELVMTMEQVFGLHARLVSEAAAAGAEELGRSVTESMDRLAAWWDQFATADVSGLNSFSGSEAAHSAKQVATALAEWRRAGSAAGDLAFWRRHVDTFSSPKAYALVVDALLEKGDHKASMALLMQWLSQAAETPLEDNEHSFHRLAMRWINSLREATGYSAAERWSLTRKFFDFLEANADEYWLVPRFSWASTRFISHDADEEEPDEDNPFAAAYEGVTYRDSTNDGFEGEVFEGGEPSEFELDEEATRITRRLAFLAAVAELWKVASATLVADGLGATTPRTTKCGKR